MSHIEKFKEWQKTQEKGREEEKEEPEPKKDRKGKARIIGIVSFNMFMVANLVRWLYLDQPYTIYDIPVVEKSYYDVGSKRI